MKKKRVRQGVAVMLAVLMVIHSFSGSGPGMGLVSYADTVRPAVVNATSLNVRSGPGTSYGIAGKLTNGSSVNVIGETTGADRKVWYQIEYGGGKKGYVLSTYLKFPVSYSNDMNFENYLNSQGFPESYKPGLRQLHAEYPNWVFKAQHTNLNWDDVISNESVIGRNLVHSSSVSSWKSTAEGAYDWNSSTWPGLDSGSYVAASDEIIRYYMDPRNFLDDKYVFQFLVHSYNASAQTADGLRSMVQNTFLGGNTNVSGAIDWNGGTGNGGNTGPGASTGNGNSTGGASQTGPGASTGNGNSYGGPSLTGPGNSAGNQGTSSGGASQTGPGSSVGNQGSTSNGGASQTGPGSSVGNQGNSSNGGVSQTGPGSSVGNQGSTSNGGVSQTGPGSSVGNQGSTSNGGASLTGPGNSAGNQGTSSGGASQTGPGSSVGNQGTTSSGGVSLTAPGSAIWNQGTSSGGASLTAPGSSTGNKGMSSGGVSLTAPGTSASNNRTSNVSFTALGTAAVGNLYTGKASLTTLGTQSGSLNHFGASISKKETNRVAVAISPGLTTGPGGSTGNSGGSTSGSGSYASDPGAGVSSGPGAGSAREPGPGSGSIGSDPGQGVGSAGGTGTASYVDIIMNAGAQSGVNPYVLAAMIIQEQGTNGTGRCISGTVAGYVGYYNFFNIEAYQSGSMDAVSRGLWYASQSGSYGRPWNSVDKSILGGALYYGTNYVNAGQDTFYLKKFNVQGSNLYKHQYMTNIQGAASEGAKLAEAYGAQVKQSALEFKIPVYLNMPGTACTKPEGNGSPNNKLSGLGVEGFAITPTFSQDITSYNLIVSPSVSSVTVNAVPLASTASISGAGTIQLQNGNNEIMVSVTAQNGTVRNYVIHVVRQDNGPAYNSALGSGVSGGSSASGPGTNSSGYGPGSGSSGQGSGPAYNSVPTGPGSGNSSGADPGYGSGSSSSAGPGASNNTTTPNNGPGTSSGNYDTNTIGPGGSNVTIVR